MATKSESKQSNRSRSSGGNNGGGATKRDSEGRFTNERSAFSWGGGNAGVLAGAAMAGAAVGLAANFGRKLVVQMPAPRRATGSTRSRPSMRRPSPCSTRSRRPATTRRPLRTTLLTKLKYALDQACASRRRTSSIRRCAQANSAHDADALNGEHGYVKTYLYELENMPKDSPDWLARVRDFRAMLEEHMRMEEDEVFPAFKQVLSEEQNAKLTAR